MVYGTVACSVGFPQYSVSKFDSIGYDQTWEHKSILDIFEFFQLKGFIMQKNVILSLSKMLHKHLIWSKNIYTGKD